MKQLLGPQSIILDLGANHGGFARAIIERFGCSCYSAEANPQLCRVIQAHPKLKVVNVAIGPEPGMMPFYICHQDEASSLRQPSATAIADTINVRVVRLEDFVQELGVSRIDLVKVDIEGAEIDVLASCSDAFLRSIPQITVEYHDFNGIIPKEDAKRSAERLRDLGFDVIRMWMRSYGDTLFVNRRLVSIGFADMFWSRRVQRNWWWFQRFVERKTGIRMSTRRAGELN